MTATARSNWQIDAHDALTASDGVAALARTVLVVTDALDEVETLGQLLIRLGYRVQVAFAQKGRIHGVPELAPDAVLFHIDRTDDADGLVAVIADHVGSPLVPLIGYLAADAPRPSALDSVLFAPAHPQQITHRVDAMIRLQAMQREILVRQQVLRASFGQDTSIAPDALLRRLRVLFIGKARPDFMVILNALRERDVEVVAAFTSFTAFDYLHGREFDAVIIDATTAIEPATAILSSMSRNVRLHHMPKIVLTSPDSRIAPDLLDRATDVITGAQPTTELANRILEPANSHRLHSQLRAEFDAMGNASVRDPDTGLYAREVLQAYTDFLRSEGETRVLCRIRLTPDADFAVDPAFVRVAMAQAGGLIAGLVRVNDLAARLSESEFAVAVPLMSAANLDRLAQRITDVIECAAFESGKKDAGPFTLMADVTIDAPEGLEEAA